MSKDDDATTYDIGFAKPPTHSRFRKGRSGNPNGRPKGRLNLATILERMLQTKVTINENGASRTATKLELALTKLVDRAVKGDVAAMRLLTTLVASAADQGVRALTNQPAASNLEFLQGVLNEATGRRLAETYLSRHGANGNEEDRE